MQNSKKKKQKNVLESLDQSDEIYLLKNYYNSITFLINKIIRFFPIFH